MLKGGLLLSLNERRIYVVEEYGGAQRRQDQDTLRPGWLRPG